MDGEKVMDKKALRQKAVRELKEYVSITLYLCVFFWMFIVYKSIIQGSKEIDFVAHGVAIINALVLGKFMLVAKAIHPGARADNAPLIYPTLLKSAIFAIALMICKILEDAAVGYFHGKSFTQSIADLGGGSWKAMLAFTIMLFIVLIPLTAFGELGRVVGEGRLVSLFLSPRDLSKPFGQQTF
jgi:hypothetical protein